MWLKHLPVTSWRVVGYPEGRTQASALPARASSPGGQKCHSCNTFFLTCSASALLWKWRSRSLLYQLLKKLGGEDLTFFAILQNYFGFGRCRSPAPSVLLDIMKNLFSTKVFKHVQEFLEFSVEISKTMLDTSLSISVSGGLAGSDHLQRFFLLNYHMSPWNTLELLSQCQNWIHKKQEWMVMAKLSLPAYRQWVTIPSVYLITAMVKSTVQIIYFFFF